MPELNQGAPIKAIGVWAEDEIDFSIGRCYRNSNFFADAVISRGYVITGALASMLVASLRVVVTYSRLSLPAVSNTVRLILASAAGDKSKLPLATV